MKWKFELFFLNLCIRWRIFVCLCLCEQRPWTPALNWTRWTHLCPSCSPAWTSSRPTSLLLKIALVRLYQSQAARAVLRCLLSYRNSHWISPSLWVLILQDAVFLFEWMKSVYKWLKQQRQIKWGRSEHSCQLSRFIRNRGQVWLLRL